jgi:hypothetical protein
MGVTKTTLLPAMLATIRDMAICEDADMSPSGDSRPTARDGRPTRMRKRRERGRRKVQTANRVQRVNLAIVGVQKAATSSLFRMLAEHPQIAGGPDKEMRFFLDGRMDWQEPDYSEYARVATKRSIRWGMDATPAYFYWPAALQRMRRYDADMRLVLSVRDPLERGFSQWAMERQRDPEFPDLRDAVHAYGLTDLPDLAETEYDAGWSRRLSLFARGRYGAQIERGLSQFPREQWLILDFRALLRDPSAIMDQITDFLGADRFTRYPDLRHNMSTSRENSGEVPTVEDVTQLIESYRDDLRIFSELSGLDVSDWPTSQVLEGRLAAAAFRDRLLAKLGLDTPGQPA